MKTLDFLKKLKKERKLELVEPSDEISLSYIKKSENCLKSAKILFTNQLYENSVTESYYSMYDLVQSLLFKTGIKCENHTASIILLKEIFNENLLYSIISFAKEERIDKQYYVESEQNYKLTEESAKDMLDKSEEFSLKIRLLIKEITNEKIVQKRTLLKELLE